MSALRERLHAFADELADLLERGMSDEWVDQEQSPLGRRRHLALAKSGKLPASKVGRRVLIRRSAIDAYLERKRVLVKSVDNEEDEDREAERLLARLRGARR